MINELIFILQTVLMMGIIYCAHVIGKEALISLVCLLCVQINFLVTKQILLFGYAATAADALAIGISLCLNLLQEYYGREIAQKTIWLGFFAACSTVILNIIHCAYVPSSFDTTHHHFVALLTPLPRIMLASLTVYLIVQFLDYTIFYYLRERATHVPLAARNFASIATTQFIDTVLFSFLGLYGIVHHLGEIIFVSYCIKLCALTLATPFLLGIKKITQSRHV